MRFTTTELTKENDPRTRHRNTARARRRAENPYDPKQNKERTRARYEGKPTEFIAIDGEGVTLWEGCYGTHAELRKVHRYVLLSVGDQHVTNPEGLTFDEIFEFLWEQFREHGTKSVAYVGFFLGYDFAQWLKNLPEDRARMLLTEQGRRARKPPSPKRPHPYPVRYGVWEFDILGTKRLKLRRHDDECELVVSRGDRKCDCGSNRWMNICDTGPFFQKSFMSVIDPENWNEPITTEAEYQTLRAGKERRSSAILDDSMLSYNALENQVLPRVLQRLNEGFQSLGIHLRPGQWFGPGQAAQLWLSDRAVTSERLREVTPPEVLEAAIASYFGGWFELFAHGFLPGITYEYDINSAYPYIISRLPCLEHGTWTHKGIIDWDHPYTLVYATVIGDFTPIGTMLHRDAKGNIYRPDNTEGWFWLHEIVAAKNAGLLSTDPKIQDWYSYDPCICPPPLREVRDIYNLRKHVGKNTPLGIACKLVPNSLYGKFAQSVGEPKHGNPVYASLITAGCRTMILNAIASHPGGQNAVRMIATDGIYFDSPHPSLPVSGELGDWDTEEKHNMTLFKPGVYWDDKARAAIKEGKFPVFKARGVSARDFGKQLTEIDRQFKKKIKRIDWPSVEFPVSFAMITAVQALQRNDWSLAGQIIENPVNRQTSRPFMKRSYPYRDGNIIRSYPRGNDAGLPSVPYKKRFGIDDPFGQENMEECGINQDGLVGMSVREALGIS